MLEGSTAGFDAGRDIHAITVNRWPHGYAYSPDLIWEPDYASEEDKPWVIGRKPYGHITIANSDSGAAANTNSAITHGYRAVREAREAAGMARLEAIAACTLRPARVLGLEAERGTLRPGARADLVILDEADRVLETWIGGRRVFSA